MQPLRERGVPSRERADALHSRSSLDWDAIRMFLEVVRHGSFRSAADQLNSSVNVLRRRIEDLEGHLKLKLLTRHIDGVRTTSEGEQILAAAQRMERESFGLVRTRDVVAPAISGEVKLAVTEG